MFVYLIVYLFCGRNQFIADWLLIIVIAPFLLL